MITKVEFANLKAGQLLIFEKSNALLVIDPNVKNKVLRENLGLRPESILIKVLFEEQLTYVMVGHGMGSNSPKLMGVVVKTQNTSVVPIFIELKDIVVV